MMHGNTTISGISRHATYLGSNDKPFSGEYLLSEFVKLSGNFSETDIGVFPGTYPASYSLTQIVGIFHDRGDSPVTTSFDAILTTTEVPEPGTLILLGSGLLGLAAVGRKKFP